jgi:hypothetical protein
MRTGILREEVNFIVNLLFNFKIWFSTSMCQLQNIAMIQWNPVLDQRDFSVEPQERVVPLNQRTGLLAG